MVDRNRAKIAKKPLIENNPDNWVREGGVDPEIKSSIPSVTGKNKNVEEVLSSSSEKSNNGKTYPHRISFDLDNSQYKRLKFSSFDSERPMNSILREAVEEWMKARNY